VESWQCRTKRFIEQPGAGVLGRAPKALRGPLDAIALELVTRRPEVLTKLGPLRA
jgi:hypothetical protein